MRVGDADVAAEAETTVRHLVRHDGAGCANREVPGCREVDHLDSLLVDALLAAFDEMEEQLGHDGDMHPSDRSVADMVKRSVTRMLDPPDGRQQTILLPLRSHRSGAHPSEAAGWGAEAWIAAALSATRTGIDVSDGAFAADAGLIEPRASAAAAMRMAKDALVMPVERADRPVGAEVSFSARREHRRTAWVGTADRRAFPPDRRQLLRETTGGRPAHLPS